MFAPRRRRLRQFSLVALLTSVAVAALVMLPVRLYVRDLMRRPDSFTGVMVEVGSKYLRSGDTFRLDPDTFYRLLLEVPAVRTLHPVRASRDPRNWLNRHFVIRQLDANAIEVLVYGRRNENVSVSDLQTLRRAAINVVQAESTKTKASVSVVGKWNGALTQ